MKFTCEASYLLRAIQTLRTFAPSGNTQTILIETLGDKACLSMTNNDCWAKYSIPATINEQGEAALNVALLAGFLQSNSTQSVTVELQEKSAVISTGKAKIKLGSEPLDVFSYIKFIESGEVTFSQQVDIGEFSRAIDLVEFATAPKKNASLYCGIHLRAFDNFLTLEATETHMVARRDIMCAEKAGDFSRVILSDLLRAFSKAIGKNEGDVTLTSNGSYFQLEYNGLLAASRMYSDRFPNYSKYIPEQFTHSIVIDRKSFSNALSLAGLATQSEATENRFRVRLKYNPGSVVIEGFSHTGINTEDEVPVEFKTGQPDGGLPNGLDSSYLMDVLSRLQSDEIRIKISGPKNPVFIESDSEPNYMFFAMPMDLK